MRTLTILFAVIVVALCSVRGASAQAKESYLFLGGVEALLLGDVNKASEYFKVVIKENPLHAPSYFYLGRIALAVDQLETAHSLVQRAIEIDSSNVTYLSTFSQILISSKQYAEAETLIARLRANEPRDQQNYLIGTALLLEIGKSSEAVKLCEQYESLFGLDERMVDLQRMSYIQTENYYLAEEYMRRVVAAFPTDVDHLLSLADLNAALRQDSTAMSYYDRAIALDTTAVEPRLAKANFYQIHGDTRLYIEELIPLFADTLMPSPAKIAIFDRHFFLPEAYRDNYAAITRLVTALLLSAPQDFDVRMLYGRFLTYTSQVDAAKTHYQTMIEQGISNTELTERLLQIYFYKEQYDKAFALASSTYDTAPTSQMMEYCVVASWLSDDNKQALRLIDRAIATYKNDSIRSGFYALQGDIYEKMGNNARSYSSYERALRYNAQNSGVLNNYAYHLSQQGVKLDRALQMAQEANRLSPDNPTYLDTEAWVLFKLGRYIDAQVLMRRVIALDGRPSADVYLHYGDILYELGDDFMARKYWKKAAEAGANPSDIEPRVLREKAIRKTE